MKVLCEYKNHHYFYEVEKSDHFCPSCGLKEIWLETGMGDYYCGPTHYCTACGCSFTLPSISPPDDREKRIVQQIKIGKTFEPKTPKGR